MIYRGEHLQQILLLKLKKKEPGTVVNKEFMDIRYPSYRKTLFQ